MWDRKLMIQALGVEISTACTWPTVFHRNHQNVILSIGEVEGRDCEVFRVADCVIAVGFAVDSTFPDVCVLAFNNIARIGPCPKCDYRKQVVAGRCVAECFITIRAEI